MTLALKLSFRFVHASLPLNSSLMEKPPSPQVCIVVVDVTPHKDPDIAKDFVLGVQSALEKFGDLMALSGSDSILSLVTMGSSLKVRRFNRNWC